jgi:hypothetical protein
MLILRALVLGAAAVLTTPLLAHSTELEPPYVCKEWNTRLPLRDDDAHNNLHTLLVWVDGWLQGYLATHPEAAEVLTGQLETFLDTRCKLYPGERLVDTLKHADFATLQTEARKREEVVKRMVIPENEKWINPYSKPRQ